MPIRPARLRIREPRKNKFCKTNPKLVENTKPAAQLEPSATQQIGCLSRKNPSKPKPQPAHPSPQKIKI
jgi:hypothetical protein